MGTMGYGLEEDISLILSNVKVNYLVRSMFTMYNFFVISVGYIILVAMQMVIFYKNLRCIDV